MRTRLGETRSRLGTNHALISPDSYEHITLPAWEGAELVHLITPHMGARHSMFLVQGTGSDLNTAGSAPGIERFVFVKAGHCRIDGDDFNAELSPEGYAYLPAGLDYRLTGSADAQLYVYERKYVPIGEPAPAAYFSQVSERTPVPLKGDERLLVRKLLPSGPEWDMEVNVMEFEPGTGLPYVETHFMEHGLVMLTGGGIYRLDEAWYPVEAGDAIWMGPHCPQWFASVGRENARYLIYKNWNRDPLG